MHTLQHKHGNVKYNRLPFKFQSEMVDFATGGATLVNWTKHTRRL